MKSFFRSIHLYLGLGAGLVISVVCFTGAMLVFEKEALTFIYAERYWVKVEGDPLSITQLEEQFDKQIPGVEIQSIRLDADPERTVEIRYSQREEKSTKVSELKEGKERSRPRAVIAFINPYTGALAGQEFERNKFFNTMFSLHRWLLAGDVGKLIVGISTFIFLFILITGIVLWWPKTKRILKQRLRLKWNVGWKRINHDLHIVIGFYTAVFLFAFAFTGLAWSFKWYNDAIYWITGTENVRLEPPTSVVPERREQRSADSVYANVKAIQPHAFYYTINFPRKADDVFSVTLLASNAAHERASDQFYFDQYTGDLKGQQLYGDRNLGQRVRTTFYPIHVGSIGGLPGRIIAFCSCLAGFTFPFTGVILWINRLKKKKRKHTASNVEEEMDMEEVPVQTH